MKNEMNKSSYHPYNEIVFECSGRRFKADCTIIGLSDDLEVYHGGDILASTTPLNEQKDANTKQIAYGLSDDEAVELASVMISRWEAYIEKMVLGKK